MPRGRPKVNNDEILATILDSAAERAKLFARLKEIEAIINQVEMYNESLKDAIASSSEALGLSKGFIGKLARLDAKGKLSEHINEAEQFRSLMELSVGAAEDSDEE